MSDFLSHMLSVCIANPPCTDEERGYHAAVIDMTRAHVQQLTNFRAIAECMRDAQTRLANHPCTDTVR